MKKIPEMPTTIGSSPKPPPTDLLDPNNGNDDPPRKTPAGALAVPEAPEKLEPPEVYSKRRAA